MRCSCFKIGLLEKQVYQTLASPLKKMFFLNLVIPKILIILVLCNFNFYFKIGAAKTILCSWGFSWNDLKESGFKLWKIAVQPIFCNQVKKQFSSRGSHQRCSMKKGVLKTFTKFTGKLLCQSLFFNKVAGLSCFSVYFVKFLITAFLQNTSGRLFHKSY